VVIKEKRRGWDFGSGHGAFFTPTMRARCDYFNKSILRVMVPVLVVRR
jgi:hypothetical protein